MRSNDPRSASSAPRILLVYCLTAALAVMLVRWLETRFETIPGSIADALVIITAALLLWLSMDRRRHNTEHAEPSEREPGLLSEPMLSELGVGFWKYQPEVDQVEISESYAAILDEPPHALHNIRPLDYVHPEDRELLQQRLQNAVTESQESFCSTHRLVNGRGEVIPVLAQGRIEHDSQGGTIMYGLDIDRRPQKAIEQHLSRLAEDLEIGLWANDFANPSQHFFSDQMFRMLGRPPAASEQAMELFLDLMHPEDLDAFRTIADEVLSPNGNSHYRSVFRLQHTDGRWIWILSTGRCVERDESGHCLRVVGAHIDISDIPALHKSEAFSWPEEIPSPNTSA